MEPALECPALGSEKGWGKHLCRGPDPPMAGTGGGQARSNTPTPKTEQAPYA